MIADLMKGRALYLHCEACGYSAGMDLKALARAPEVVAVCPSDR